MELTKEDIIKSLTEPKPYLKYNLLENISNVNGNKLEPEEILVLNDFLFTMYNLKKPLILITKLAFNTRSSGDIFTNLFYFDDFYKLIIEDAFFPFMDSEDVQIPIEILNKLIDPYQYGLFNSFLFNIASDLNIENAIISPKVIWLSDNVIDFIKGNKLIGTFNQINDICTFDKENLENLLEKEENKDILLKFYEINSYISSVASDIVFNEDRIYDVSYTYSNNFKSLRFNYRTEYKIKIEEEFRKFYGSSDVNHRFSLFPSYATNYSDDIDILISIIKSDEKINEIISSNIIGLKNNITKSFKKISGSTTSNSDNIYELLNNDNNVIITFNNECLVKMMKLGIVANLKRTSYDSDFPYIIFSPKMMSVVSKM